MLEGWNPGILGFKFGKKILLTLKSRKIPIKTNPFIHYSIIPLFQYNESAWQ